MPISAVNLLWLTDRHDLQVMATVPLENLEMFERMGVSFPT